MASPGGFNNNNYDMFYYAFRISMKIKDTKDNTLIKKNISVQNT